MLIVFENNEEQTIVDIVLFVLYRKLLQLSGETLQPDDCKHLKNHLVQAMSLKKIPRNEFDMNPIIRDMQTAVIMAEEMGMRRASILGVILHDTVKNGVYPIEFIQ